MSLRATGGGIPPLSNFMTSNNGSNPAEMMMNMHNFSNLRSGLIASAAALLVTGSAVPVIAAPATPLAPLAATATAAGNTAATVTEVGYKRRYDNRKYGRYVDAPYTRYDRYERDVDVDAPYAYVRRSRGGVRVRAPYVDLYIPRRRH